MKQSWTTNVPSGSSHDVAVLKFGLGSIGERPLPAGFKPISERARRLRDDPSRTQGIADARKWLSEQSVLQPGSLKQLRLAKGLSQQQLADLVHTTQAQIARLEKGMVDPQISTVCRVAQALEVTSVEVFVMLKHE